MKNKIANFLLNIFIVLIIIAIFAGLSYVALKMLNIEVDVSDFNNTVSTITGKNLDTIKPLNAIENGGSTAQIPVQQEEKTVSTANVEEVGNKYKFYYSQISDNAKKIYDKLSGNIEGLKTGTAKFDFGKSFEDVLKQENGKEQLNADYQAALDALTMDYPEIFYIDVTKMSLMIYTETSFRGTSYEVTIEPMSNGNYLDANFGTAEAVRNAVSQIEGIRNQIIEQTKNDNRYTKIKKIHDFLVNYLEYDDTLERPNTRNIYGALIEKTCVCEGYAESFKYLMDAVGVPCIEAVGTGTNSAGANESHAWNYVLMDNNKWYAVDCTWDDPKIIGGGQATSVIYHKYFLVGGNTFFKNHFPSGEISSNGFVFGYPEISAEKYD